MSQRKIWPGLVIVTLSLLIGILAGTSHGMIKPGEIFPDMFFDLSKDKNAQQYLNLKGEKKNIAEIDADVLVLEVMSVYCVSCMAQAPFDRQLFSMIQDSPKTAGKVKMIGVGVGNHQTEVSKFISKYNTPYPVFTDPDFSKYDQIGQVRTPFKIFLKKEKGMFRIVKTELGVHKNVEETFQTIVDILEGRYSADKEVAIAATEKKSLDLALAMNLLKEWLTRRGEDPQVKELFEDSGRFVYRIGAKEGLFAILIHRVSVCDVCKDIQFIYTMDASGKVVDIIPIQLTKMYNVPFTQDDVAKVKKSIILRNVNTSILYDSMVDAVSSATITTGIIFDSINKGSDIHVKLKEKGLIR